MLDDWTVQVSVVSLCIIALFIYLNGKSGDKSIFSKPTHHEEIKTFRIKLP